MIISIFLLLFCTPIQGLTFKHLVKQVVIIVIEQNSMQLSFNLRSWWREFCSLELHGSVLEANVLATATLILPIPKRHIALTSKETVIFCNALKETVIFYNGSNLNRFLPSTLTIIQHSRIILGGLPFFEALPTSCMFHLGLFLETLLWSQFLFRRVQFLQVSFYTVNLAPLVFLFRK